MRKCVSQVSDYPGDFPSSSNVFIGFTSKSDIADELLRDSFVYFNDEHGGWGVVSRMDFELYRGQSKSPKK